MKKVVIALITFFMILNVDASSTIKYLSQHTTDNIIIDTTTGDVKLNNKNIKINDYEVYQNILSSGNPDNYPLYIIYDNSGYSFSDYKKTGTVYILSNKFLSMVVEGSATNITSCDGLLGIQFINLLKSNVFKTIYILIPILFIVLSTFDFFKLVFSDSKDGIPGAFKKLSKRAIASVLIFFIPTILIFLTNILGTNEVRTCVETFQTTNNVN